MSATAPRHTTTVTVDRRGPGRRPGATMVNAAPRPDDRPEGPSPLVGFLACLAILTGGAFAGHAWLVDTCPTTSDARTVAVCAAVLR